MATKDHKRQAKGLIEQLEGRVHAGPPVNPAEINQPANSSSARNSPPPAIITTASPACSIALKPERTLRRQSESATTAVKRQGIGCRFNPPSTM